MDLFKFHGIAANLSSILTLDKEYPLERNFDALGFRELIDVKHKLT